MFFEGFFERKARDPGHAGQGAAPPGKGDSHDGSARPARRSRAGGGIQTIFRRSIIGHRA